MRLDATESVLSQPIYFPILDVLCLLIEDRKHEIDALAIRKFVGSDWCRSRGESVRSLLTLSVRARSLDSIESRSLVILDETTVRQGVVAFEANETRIHPRDAIAFLSVPFNVIVENECNDGAFLLWMARAVGLPRFVEAYRAERFVFRHAGGKDAFPGCAKILSHGVWPRADSAYSRHRRLWACAVMDSDDRYPGHGVNRELARQAEEYVSFVHILRKRTIENYIPREILVKMQNDEPFVHRVEALFRLTDQQRTHYSIKRGFRFSRDVEPTKTNYAESNAVAAQEKALFQTINDNDWLLLMSGFGRGPVNCFQDEQLRPEPSGYRALPPDDRAEMLDLLRRIYERL